MDDVQTPCNGLGEWVGALTVKYTREPCVCQARVLYVEERGFRQQMGPVGKTGPISYELAQGHHQEGIDGGESLWLWDSFRTIQDVGQWWP
jgi:hypothetical protein